MVDKLRRRTLILVLVAIFAVNLLVVSASTLTYVKAPPPVSSVSTSPVITTHVNTGSSSSQSSSLTSSTQEPGPRISLPLYASPNETAEWNQVIQSSPTTGILILNPDFGPGYSKDNSYASIIASMHQQGVKVLGYVYTTYANGAVSVGTVKNWIKDWYSWYQVDGIFFDEVNSTCSASNVNYYSALYTYTKSEPGTDIVVLNPGEGAGSCYASISDIIVTFEGNYAQFLNNYIAENWTKSYPPSHFWEIIYNATTLPQMQNAVQVAFNRGSGWIYVTNDQAIGVNALGHLPSYFCQEVETVEPSNTACAKNATATTGLR